jgi:hypothetical protein
LPGGFSLSTLPLESCTFLTAHFNSLLGPDPKRWTKQAWGGAEEFIAEFEGVGKDYDVTRRGQFTDIRVEMLKLPQQASFNP